MGIYRPLSGYRLLLTVVVVGGLVAMASGFAIATGLILPKMQQEAQWPDEREQVANACEIPVSWVHDRPSLVVGADGQTEWRRYVVTVPEKVRARKERRHKYTAQFGQVRRDGTVVCQLG